MLDSALPIVAAPMAGGPTTVALAAAVQSAGGFPFLAAGYKTVDAVAADLRALRQHGSQFGVNLFVPSGSPIDRGAFRAYALTLEAEARAVGVRLSTEPHRDDDAWADKVDLLVSDPVPVVSLTFGLPSDDAIARLQRAGSRVLASVTSAAEAQQAADAGVDGLVVQGTGAGGHSAMFDPAGSLVPQSTANLVQAVRAVCALPITAAGGVDGRHAVEALLAAGASAVAVGTMLLRTDEAGTSAPHRAALADPAFDETVLTHAFTGRPARALRNAFTERYTPVAPLGYPEIHHLTRELRQAAGRAADQSRMHLWAGTGYRSAPLGPVADVIAELAG